MLDGTKIATDKALVGIAVSFTRTDDEEAPSEQEAGVMAWLLSP